jgi:ribosomal protein L9
MLARSLARRSPFAAVARRTAVRHARTVAAIVIDEAAPANVGDLYETVEVKPGYMRNFLFPNQLAVYATHAAQQEYAPLRAAREAELAERAARTAALDAEREEAQRRADAERTDAGRTAEARAAESRAAESAADEAAAEAERAAAAERRAADAELQAALLALEGPARVTVRANESGGLYAKLDPADVAAALATAAGKPVAPESVLVAPEHNSIGVHQVIVRLSDAEIAVPVELASD